MHYLDIQEELFPKTDKRSVETRLAIIDAFISVVCEQGPFRLSFEAIATQCNLNRSQVRYHFKDFETLLISSIKFVNYLGQFEVVKTLEKAESPRDQLFAFIDGTYNWFQNNKKHFQIMLLAMQMSDANDELRTLYHSTRNFGRKRVELILNEFGKLNKIDINGKEFQNSVSKIQFHILGAFLNLTQATISSDEVRVQLVNEARKLCKEVALNEMQNLLAIGSSQFRYNSVVEGNLNV